MEKEKIGMDNEEKKLEIEKKSEIEVKMEEEKMENEDVVWGSKEVSTDELGKSTKRRLSDRQQRFCEQVAKGATPEDAAVWAGYKEKTAGSWAKRFMAMEEVRLEIERIKSGSSAAEEEILRFLTAVMRGEVQDNESGGAKPPKVSERTKAAELLGKNQRLFSDRERVGSSEAVVRILGADELE